MNPELGQFFLGLALFLIVCASLLLRKESAQVHQIGERYAPLAQRGGSTMTENSVMPHARNQIQGSLMTVRLLITAGIVSAFIAARMFGWITV